MSANNSLSQVANALVRQMNDDLDWVTQHEQDLLRQYGGELIVVHKREVIAHGQNEAELLREAVRAEHPREELVVVEMLSERFEIAPDALT